MNLLLPHVLLLIELDDETGISTQNDTLVRTYALAAAYTAELQLQDRLVPVEADRFAITSVGQPPSGSLGIAEKRLAGRRPLTFDRAAGRVGDRYSALRRAALAELVEAGALREEKDSVWILTWRTRWPTGDPAVEEGLIEHLRRWIETVQPEDPPGREDLLFSLIRVSKLMDRVLSPAAQERFASTILERTARAPIGVTVRDLARAAAAAAMVATM